MLKSCKAVQSAYLDNGGIAVDETLWVIRFHERIKDSAIVDPRRPDLELSNAGDDDAFAGVAVAHDFPGND